MKTALEILKSLPRKESYHFFLSIGVEYECFVFDEKGDMVDLEEHRKFLVEVGEIAGNGIRCLDIEVGKNMLEIVLEPANSLEEYFDMFFGVFSFLAKRETSNKWRFLFSDNLVNPGPTEIDLYMALHRANGFDIAVSQLSKYASLQTNFGMKELGGVYSDDSKKILYVLNNFAPALSLYFEDWAGIKSDRLSNVFTGFKTGEMRLPHPLSWEYIQNVKENLLNIPYIIKDVNGKWVDALSDPAPLDKINDFHCKMIWWFARINGVDSLKEERIEPRFLNVVDPASSGDVLKKMDKIVRHIVGTDMSKFSFLNDDDWWYLRNQKFKCLEMARDIVLKNFYFLE